MAARTKNLSLQEMAIVAVVMLADITGLKVLVHTGEGGRLFTEVRLLGISKAEGEDGLADVGREFCPYFNQAGKLWIGNGAFHATDFRRIL
jgi:hypothetical protein